MLQKTLDFTDNVGNSPSSKGVTVKEMHVAEITTVLASSSGLYQVRGEVTVFYKCFFTDRS